MKIALAMLALLLGAAPAPAVVVPVGETLSIVFAERRVRVGTGMDTGRTPGPVDRVLSIATISYAVVFDACRAGRGRECRSPGYRTVINFPGCIFCGGRAVVESAFLSGNRMPDMPEVARRLAVARFIADRRGPRRAAQAASAAFFVIPLPGAFLLLATALAAFGALTARRPPVVVRASLMGRHAGPARILIGRRAESLALSSPLTDVRALHPLR